MKSLRQSPVPVRRFRLFASMGLLLGLAVGMSGEDHVLATGRRGRAAVSRGVAGGPRWFGPAAVTEREVPATADATIAAEEPDRNFRLAADLMVHHAPAIGSVAEQIKFALLQFDDLSAIPAGSQLQYAWLRLKLLGASGAARTGRSPVWASGELSALASAMIA